MPRDAAGVPRVGMFDMIRDNTNGVTYSPTTGIDGTVTYRGSNGTSLTTSTRRMTGEQITDAIRWRDEYGIGRAVRPWG